MTLRVIVTGSSVTVIVALEPSVTVRVSAGGVTVTVSVLWWGGKGGNRVGWECSSDVVDVVEVVEGGGGGESEVLLVVVMIGGKIVVYVDQLVLQSHALSYSSHVIHSVNTPLSSISPRASICPDATSSPVPHTKEPAIRNGSATRLSFMVKFNDFNL